MKWFNPFNAGGAVNLLVRAGTFLLSDRGSAMVSSIVETLGGVVIMALLLWIASLVGRRIRGPMMMACVVCAFALQSAPSHAVEIRHNEEGRRVDSGGRDDRRHADRARRHDRGERQRHRRRHRVRSARGDSRQRRRARDHRRRERQSRRQRRRQRAGRCGNAFSVGAQDRPQPVRRRRDRNGRPAQRTSSRTCSLAARR